LGHIEGVKRPPILLSAGLGVLGVLGVAAAGSGCGPSFQALYEGNSRFEHCYALEENPQAPMQGKADCWRDWSEHYTYGQTRDRVQYAIARYVALSQAPNIPTDEALMNAAPGVVTPRVREQTITAPTPTNAFAPPPKVLEAEDAGPPPSATPSALPSAAPPAPVGMPLPASACGDSCGAAYQSCRASCRSDGGAPSPRKVDPCRACDGAYRGCMRACFK
jgi:hypothetical protein